MSIKKKLSLGLGFLFLIIFALVAFSLHQISKLSKDAANILKDNYASLLYADNMMFALDDMMMAAGSRVANPPADKRLEDYHSKLFESGRGEFEKNLKAENNNVTEVHEKEFVEKLNADYAVYLDLGLQIMKGEGSPALFFGELQPAYMALSSPSETSTTSTCRRLSERMRSPNRIRPGSSSLWLSSAFSASSWLFSISPIFRPTSQDPFPIFQVERGSS